MRHTIDLSVKLSSASGAQDFRRETYQAIHKSGEWPLALVDIGRSETEEWLTFGSRSSAAFRRYKLAVLCRRLTGIPLSAHMSAEDDRKVGHITEDDRWDVKISKDGVYEANLLDFRPDDIYNAMAGG